MKQLRERLQELAQDWEDEAHSLSIKIDGLERDGGEFSLEIAFPGYQTQELNLNLKESINVGTIYL